MDASTWDLSDGALWGEPEPAWEWNEDDDEDGGVSLPFDTARFSLGAYAASGERPSREIPRTA